MMEKLVKLIQNNPTVRMIELPKLSQGAKPGKRWRNACQQDHSRNCRDTRRTAWQGCCFTALTTAHSRDVKSMVDFIEQMAAATGLPVGIKSAVGKTDMWEELAKTLMMRNGKRSGFYHDRRRRRRHWCRATIFADHVSLPLVFAFSTVYKIFQKRNLNDKITFIASGKLGLPAQAVMAFAMGADVINVAREAMLSTGCIQAQSCHYQPLPYRHCHQQ